jgi:hypothetical protein
MPSGDTGMCALYHAVRCRTQEDGANVIVITFAP